MKLKSLSLLLFVSCLSLAAVELVFNDAGLEINGSFELEAFGSEIVDRTEYTTIRIHGCQPSGQPGGAMLQVFNRLVYLPAEGSYKVTDFSYNYDEITIPGRLAPFLGDEPQDIDSYSSEDEWLPQERVLISEPMIMRDYRFQQIALQPLQYNAAQNKIRILKDIHLVMEFDSSDQTNQLNQVHTLASPSFKLLAESLLSGFEDTREERKGSYLIIAPDAQVQSLQPLRNWKQRLGYPTVIAPLSQTGQTNVQIKAFIQNAYDTWEIPPEFVILVGDVSGSIQVPAFYIPGYLTNWDVTDHSYTLLAGDDYFPDVLIGRLSVQSLNQLHTIINKIVNYESNPYQSSNWINRALMITYVDDYWQGYFSARETKREIRRKLLGFAYTEVDTFYAPYQTSQAQLINMINGGYSLINYRGAGAPSYWWGGSFVLFNIENINSLNNGFMLPLVTSMTCGGGDFADSWYPTCFGETWLAAGTPTLPKGAIGFIGPSEHDTKTPFNNANDMGIYQGITQEGLQRCGELLLRGKMELYNNYPFGHSMDGYNDSLDSDEFYFYVYNLLGDPGLSVWTDTPREFEFICDTVIPAGANYLELSILEEGDGAGFTVSITDDDSLYASGTTPAGGTIFLPHSLPVGQYSLTVSRQGFLPETTTLAVIEEDIVCLQDYQLSGLFHNGASINLQITLQNLSDSNAENITAQLSCQDDQINLMQNSFYHNLLLSGQQVTGNLSFTVGEDWNNGKRFDFFLEVSSNLGSYLFLIPLELNAPELAISNIIVDNPETTLLPGVNNQVYLEVLNTGNLETLNFNMSLTSSGSQIEITEGSSSFGNIAPGGSGTSQTAFGLEVAAEVIEGSRLPLELLIISGTDTLYSHPFEVLIGTIDITSPTISSYGYIAIESRDEGNFQAPEYDWVELNPAQGGAGTLLSNNSSQIDGFTSPVSLPFTFRYFGVDYNEISICSNGWLAMGSTELVFFRNRLIPSGVGAPAMIAPFWDYIKWGDIFTWYDANLNRFIIQWDDWQSSYNPYYHDTFEVILYDPQFYPAPGGEGPILFQYQEVNNVDAQENYATVGIENAEQTAGLLLTFANIYDLTMHTLADETAILITTGNGLYTSVEQDELPPSPHLRQNFPNPFRMAEGSRQGGTSFQIELASLPDLALSIYNLKGQRIRQFTLDTAQQAELLLFWDGRDEHGRALPAGIYYYQLQSGRKVLETKKCLLLK